MYINWILLVCLKLFGLMDSKFRLKEDRDLFLYDPVWWAADNEQEAPLFFVGVGDQ